MEGLVPADLRAESDNEQDKEERFIEIILELRQKRITEVQLEILPSGINEIDTSSIFTMYFSQ